MEEQNNRLLEVIQLWQKNLQKIKSKLGQAEDLLKCGSRDEYVYEELLKAVSLTEKFNLNIRDLAYYVWGPYAYDQVKEIIADTVPVEIGHTKQGWFSVRLPMLLPKKQSGGLEYRPAYFNTDFYPRFLVYSPVFGRQRQNEQTSYYATFI